MILAKHHQKSICINYSSRNRI